MCKGKVSEYFAQERINTWYQVGSLQKRECLWSFVIDTGDEQAVQYCLRIEINKLLFRHIVNQIIPECLQFAP